MHSGKSVNTAVAAEFGQLSVTQVPNSTPVRRLLVAMIAQSADDIQMFRASPKVTGQRIYREARNWVLSESAEHPFSFVSICDVLAYSPEAVRSAIFATPQRRVVAGAALAPAVEEMRFVESESEPEPEPDLEPEPELESAMILADEVYEPAPADAAAEL